MTAISLGPYYAAVLARLATTLVPTEGRPNAFLGEPQANRDRDGAARPYAALYPSPGWQHGVSLSGPSDQARLTFQVTAAGGDTDRALRAIDRTRAALLDWVPGAPGVECGRLTEPDDYDPGPLRVDRDVTPYRWWAPLLFTGLIWLPEGATP